MSKKRIYILALLTLGMIPLAFGLNYFQNFSLFDKIFSFHWMDVTGIFFGSAFAFIVLFFSEKFKENPLIKNQKELLNSLSLNYFDGFFLGFCAGIAEEILFRGVLQAWFGIWITSFVFVLIHGYFSLKEKSINAFGLLLFVFILCLAIANNKIGLWFCIFAHWMYDFCLFAYSVYTKKHTSEVEFTDHIESEDDPFFEEVNNLEQ